MPAPEVAIAGTLKPDGSLELDGKPDLPPGARVRVVLRPEAAPSPPAESAPSPPAESWWDFMQRSRRELEAAWSEFMNEEEVEAHIAWLREGDRIDEMLSQTEPPR